MRLRSNSPFEPTGLNPRIEIARYSDGRGVGYDPRTSSGFDVGGLSVSVNDVIAYDRLGSLTWDGEEWREWVYAQVGLAVPIEGEAPPSVRTAAPPPVEPESRTAGLSMLLVALVLVIGCAGAFFLGTLVTAPSPRGIIVQDKAVVTEPSQMPAPATGIERGPSDSTPAYVVVSSGVETGIGRVGNVLVTSNDAGTSVERHRDICRAVSIREKFQVVRLFRTADAYVAMRDERFREENPEALPFGFLGIMVEGRFYSAEQLNGSTAIPKR